jgi:phosphate transport system substrate-binding protein
MNRILVAALASILAAPLQAATLSIKGSNTFGEELGPALIAGFAATHPGVEISLESRGSGSGIDALLDGTGDLASSSRPLNEDELRRATSRQLTLDTHVVGYYGIALIVNNRHPVRALDDRAIEAIFTGRITNWSKVGGPDAPIALHIRNREAGTYLGFRELAMDDQPYAESATEHPSYHDIADAVAADPNAIGFVPLNMTSRPGLLGVIINGIHPVSTAVTEGLYPYARQVRLISDRDRLNPPAREFLRYIRSRDGQQIVEKTGFVPRFTARMDLGPFGP